MIMLDFICKGSTELFGTDWDWKIQNKNIYLQRELNPRLVKPRPVDQRFRPLDHDVLMMICFTGGIKLITPLRDNTCQNDYGYMCIWTDCQTKSTFHLNVDFS